MISRVLDPLYQKESYPILKELLMDISKNALENQEKPEYYMFSVFDVKNVKWVRNPITTLDELREWLRELSKNPSKYRGVQITTEDILSTKIKWVDDKSDAEELITLRQLHYGDRYEDSYQYFKEPENLKRYKEAVNNCNVE